MQPNFEQSLQQKLPGISEQLFVHKAA